MTQESVCASCSRLVGVKSAVARLLVFELAAMEFAPCVYAAVQQQEQLGCGAQQFVCANAEWD